MKILVNRCYGGFGFSDQFYEALGWVVKEKGSFFKYYEPTEEWKERYPQESTYYDDRDIRTNPEVIALFEEKGSEWSSGGFAKLDLVEIPDDIRYEIDEYDGIETIREEHRTW